MFDKDILEFDNQMLHCEVAFEQACFEQSLNLRKIQNKIVLENADTESADLIDLYVSEAKESGEKKKNIFIRLIDSIKKFIMKIINKLTGNKFVPKEDKKVPGNPKELMQKGRELINKAKMILSSPKGRDVAKKAAIGTAAVGTTAFVIKAANQGPTLKEIHAFMKETGATLDGAKAVLNRSDTLDEEKAVAQAYINEYGKIASRLGKVMNAIMGKSDLDARSTLDKDIEAEKGPDTLNGLTTAELKAKRDELKQRIETEKKNISLGKQAGRAISGKADKSGYTANKNAAYTSDTKAEIQRLQALVDRCNFLLQKSGERDGHNAFASTHIS